MLTVSAVDVTLARVSVSFACASASPASAFASSSSAWSIRSAMRCAVPWIDSTTPLGPMIPDRLASSSCTRASSAAERIDRPLGDLDPGHQAVEHLEPLHGRHDVLARRGVGRPELEIPLRDAAEALGQGVRERRRGIRVARHGDRRRLERRHLLLHVRDLRGRGVEERHALGQALVDRRRRRCSPGRRPIRGRAARPRPARGTRRFRRSPTTWPVIASAFFDPLGAAAAWRCAGVGPPATGAANGGAHRASPGRRPARASGAACRRTQAQARARDGHGLDRLGGIVVVHLAPRLVRRVRAR